jgi:hypothetical protein
LGEDGRDMLPERVLPVEANFGGVEQPKGRSSTSSTAAFARVTDEGLDEGLRFAYAGSDMLISGSFPTGGVEFDRNRAAFS